MIILAVSAQSAGASTITINVEPGDRGSSFGFLQSHLGELAGTHYDGQTLSLDLLFSDEFLVAPAVHLNLALHQAGAIGTSPTTGLTVSGYFLAAGLPPGPTMDFPLTGWSPAVESPAGDYLLEDGTRYLAATTSYSLQINGPVKPSIDPLAFPLIEPHVFSGLHFDITFPDTADVLIGGRFSISNYEAYPFSDPIRVSPDAIPAYPYTLPDSSDTALLLVCGLLAIVVIRAKVFGQVLARACRSVVDLR